ncbi:hypothetical protein [Cerasicoccus frondis]|uniref:hypothetical protein n=1 Tax=Cerasicoccus frondis TaxID=490090 RepID=UPI0028526518|nr:hypothetical protein [Cerasicoccus frondis]
MSRSASRWDHRLLFKIALFGGISQLVLIPVFILIGSFLGGEEGTAVESESDESEAAGVQMKVYQIHDDSGALDAQLLLEASLQATYGDIDPGLHSLIMRGAISLGNGEVADYSLMRRDDGQMREVTDAKNIRIEYTSDGKSVRRSRSREAKGELSEVESVGESLWYLSRMAVGMPLGGWPSDDLADAKLDVDGDYYLRWQVGSTVQEVRLDSDTYLIQKSRLVMEGSACELKFDDYKLVGGMQLPHRIDIDYSDGRFPESIVVEQYQINPGLLTSLFVP